MQMLIVEDKEIEYLSLILVFSTIISILTYKIIISEFLWFIFSRCVFIFLILIFLFSSVTQSSPNSLQPHELQHARPPCPSPTLRVHSKLMSIESMMPSSHLILCRPLFLLPPIPSSIKVFSNESALCLRWPKNWSFCFSIIPSKEHSRSLLA